MLGQGIDPLDAVFVTRIDDRLTYKLLELPEDLRKRLGELIEAREQAAYERGKKDAENVQPNK